MYSLMVVKGVFVVGFISGFFFSALILDRMYRESFKKYANELYYQYKTLLNRRKGD